MKIRRTEFLFIYHTNGNFADLKYYLDSELLEEGQALVISILLGQEVIIDQLEIQTLFEIPTNKWINLTGIKMELSRLQFFINNGILLSDDPDNKRAVLFKYRDQVLKEEEWNIYAALYHFTSRWGGIDGSLPFFVFPDRYGLEQIEDEISRIQTHKDRIPGHFHTFKRDTSNLISLDPVHDDGEFYTILKNRKTSRNFRTDRPMEQQELSKLIFYVFGHHGILEVKSQYKILKKNNASTGSLHSIEVYLLVLNVNGLRSGIYHYQTKNHNLNLLKTYGKDEAITIAKDIACQQQYVENAAALFILTSRFYRSFWKYRKHPKILNYHLRESGFISQNFYLVCEKMGLGAFTTSMNEIDADREIGIDGFKEGSIALLGCGYPNLDEEKMKYPESRFNKTDSFDN